MNVSNLQILMATGTGKGNSTIQLVMEVDAAANNAIVYLIHVGSFR